MKFQLVAVFGIGFPRQSKKLPGVRLSSKYFAMPASSGRRAIVPSKMALG